MKRLSFFIVLAFAISAHAGTPQRHIEQDYVSGIEKTCMAIKNPTDWLSLSADLRLRAIYMKNPIMLNDKSRDPKGFNSEWTWQRYRARIGAQIRPVKDSSLEFNIRAVWEYRNYCKSESLGETHNDELIFDRFNLKWTMPVGDAKLTTTIGRQDIIKGGGWLILDGTPIDDSRTIHFDAARFQFELPDKKTLDLMYIYQTPNSKWLPRIAAQHGFLMTEQVEQGAVAWYTDRNNPLGFLAQADAYFIYKQCEAVTPVGVDADLYTFGVSGMKHLDAHWTVSGEIAGQFGRKNGDRVCAMATNNRLTYSCNDANKTRFHLDYEYLSGDKRPGDGVNNGFDPLWGRWARVSEVYAYTVATEAGHPGEMSNFHRVGLLWDSVCNEKINVCGGYQLLFAPQPITGPGSGSGNFRGQLYQARMNYKINEHVSGHLMAEYFIPGSAYDSTRTDPAIMLRYELMFKL